MTNEDLLAWAIGEFEDFNSPEPHHHPIDHNTAYSQKLALAQIIATCLQTQAVEAQTAEQHKDINDINSGGW